MTKEYSLGHITATDLAMRGEYKPPDAIVFSRYGGRLTVRSGDFKSMLRQVIILIFCQGAR